MEVTGILKAKFDTQKVSDRFQKREFVLTTESTTPYPQHVSFQLTQDKCGEIDAHNIGDEIRVQFNLQGREWNGPQGIKYFNTLDAWKIQKGGAGSTTTKSSSPASANVEQPTSMSSSSSDFDNDDAPF